MTDKESVESTPVFLTQKQLAQRWQMSESCVKNYREKGMVPYFRLPKMGRVLYPVGEIEKIENEQIKSCGKETDPKPNKKRKALEVSSTNKEVKWRI
jgi:hypothetical protein